jgi:hypothetical protein
LAKPFENLANNKTIKAPVTLLRVNSQLSAPDLAQDERDWVEKGNILVILGHPSASDQSALIPCTKRAMGKVKINTARRNLSSAEKQLGEFALVRLFGKKYRQGRTIFATTPDLAANAYQNFRGNYEFLAQLVTQSGEEENSSIANSVWVDEYLHGYRDTDAPKRKQEQDIFSYFVKLPYFQLWFRLQFSSSLPSGLEIVALENPKPYPHPL